MGPKKGRPVPTERQQDRVVAALLAYSRHRLGGGSYTGDRAANRFVNENNNAFLFGAIFDQGIPYEKAWAAPHLLKRALGHFNMARLASTPLPQLARAVRKADDGKALHRFVNKLPRWLKETARKLTREYAGDAGNIWRDCLTAGEVIERLDEFPGIGLKKAHMVTRDLYEDGHQLLRWRDINVAVDVHVTRVFRRSGLVRSVKSGEILAAAARLHPRYPGALDWPAWTIGLNWCKASRPDCNGHDHDDHRPCPLNRVCPKLSRRRLRLGA